MTNSFYPAAQKVAKNPIIRWLAGALLALLTATLTTGVWPFFRGWVVTRADISTVEQLELRLERIEKTRTVDFERLNSGQGDDTGALTEAEQLQWAILRIKRLEMRVVRETRARIGLEVMLRMPNPRSDAAKRAAAQAKGKFDALLFQREDLGVAEQKALEYVSSGNPSP